MGLAIGNSRLHWGLFQGSDLIALGDCPHLAHKVERDSLIQQILGSQSLDALKIYLASVVPSQTELWLDYPQLQQITLKDIPLKNIYPTMGIDRALAIWGAGETYGYPCLVIDGGTALTFTGIDAQRQLVGGAILPGLRTQLKCLSRTTAALPEIVLPSALPPRWALDTKKAIAGGIIYTVLAGIESFIVDWCQCFPQSLVILTGGDAEPLHRYLKAQSSELTTAIIVDQRLIFWGIKLIK